MHIPDHTLWTTLINYLLVKGEKETLNKIPKSENTLHRLGHPFVLGVDFQIRYT